MPRHALGRRSRRLAWLAGLAVVAVARVGDAQVGVVPAKLVVLDKGAGGAKTVFVAKDAAIQRGTGIDPSGIAIMMTILYDNGTDAPSWGGFLVPPGFSTGWVAYNEKVARYVNRETFTATRVVVIRPGKLAKLVGDGLGDLDPLEILGQGGAPTGVAKTAFCVQDGSATPPFSQCYCSAFAGCTWKSIGGTGAKLVCRGGTADPTCGALTPPTTTTSTVVTSTTTTTDPPRPVCCSVTVTEPFPATSCHWSGTAAACSASGGTPGPAGSICQPTGGCAAPPVAAGECCTNIPQFVGCVSIVPPGSSALCSAAGGTPVPNAVCLPDGSCAAPTDFRCCDSYAADPGGDICLPPVVRVSECLDAVALPGAPGTFCGGGGDCLPTPTAGTCCDVPTLDYPCYQTSASCGPGLTTVPNSWCNTLCQAL